MVREINGLGGIPGAPKTTESKTTEQGARKSSGSAPVKTGGSESSGQTDGVQLSSEARTLQSLTDQVKNLPDANLERAEQIRQALESGQYKIDDLVVADKLMQSEALFGK